MARYRPARGRTDCAIVAQDGEGRWAIHGLGGVLPTADNARAAILLALYGAWPVSTVLLVPPRTGSVS
jgi:hypothetical protein